MSLTPAGFSSVMAHRAPTDPDELDYFPTPPWAARAGGELIKRLDPAARTCWEPAAGGGHMAEGLRDYFDLTWLSDVHPYGPHLDAVGDFVTIDSLDAAPSFGQPDWIVTNPPFKSGSAFVETGYGLARCGVAMLLRLVFMEGQARHKLLYGDTPVTVIAPFCERVPMVKGRWDPDASSATAYAWFIWIKDAPAGDPRVIPIAPGAKKRLSRPHDQAFAGVTLRDGIFGEFSV